MNVGKIALNIGNSITSAATKATGTIGQGTFKVANELQNAKIADGVSSLQNSSKGLDAFSANFRKKAAKAITYVRSLCDKAENTLGTVNETCVKVSDGVKNKISSTLDYFKKQPTFKAHQG